MGADPGSGAGLHSGGVAVVGGECDWCLVHGDCDQVLTLALLCRSGPGCSPSPASPGRVWSSSTCSASPTSSGGPSSCTGECGSGTGPGRGLTPCAVLQGEVRQVVARREPRPRQVRGCVPAAAVGGQLLLPQPHGARLHPGTLLRPRPARACHGMRRRGGRRGAAVL